MVVCAVCGSRTVRQVSAIVVPAVVAAVDARLATGRVVAAFYDA